MEARHHDEQNGSDTVIFYGVSITDADIIMGDGKSLEHAGVIPDELLLPSANALSNNRDPVLARAAEPSGSKSAPSRPESCFLTSGRRTKVSHHFRHWDMQVRRQPLQATSFCSLRIPASP